MHEAGPVRDAIRRAESEAARHGGKVTAMHMRVSGMSTRIVRHLAEAVVRDRWGYLPDLEIEAEADPGLPHSQGRVVLVSVSVEA